MVWHCWRRLVGRRWLPVSHGGHGAGRGRRVWWVWGLTLTRPLTVLTSPDFWIISTAHRGIRGPMTLPAGIRVAHVVPGVPHVPLMPTAGVRGWGWSTTHHAMLRRSLPTWLHAITSIWIGEWALHGPTFWVTILAIHVRLLTTVLHTIGFTLMPLRWRAIHPFPRPLITLQQPTNKMFKVQNILLISYHK